MPSLTDSDVTKDSTVTDFTLLAASNTLKAISEMGNDLDQTLSRDVVVGAQATISAIIKVAAAFLWCVTNFRYATN